jgi:hypothetical protein
VRTQRLSEYEREREVLMAEASSTFCASTCRRTSEREGCCSGGVPSVYVVTALPAGTR